MASSSDTDIPLTSLSNNTGALNANDNSFNRDQSHNRNHAQGGNVGPFFFYGHSGYASDRRPSSQSHHRTQDSPNPRRGGRRNSPHENRNGYKFGRWHFLFLLFLVIVAIGLAVGLSIGLRPASESKGNVSHICSEITL
jgi:hypothetical protein